MDAFRHNHAVFDDARVAGGYERLNLTGTRFLNGGEQAALLLAAPHGRDAAVLDVGVGAGRTTALLRLITDDYVAVDYSPRMVEAFRRHHPGLDCRVADARDLGAFADRRFGLVLFSNNGIDAVDHDDRGRVLAELARVVTDDGVVVFSTLNKDGPSFGESPFRLRRPTMTLSASRRETVLRIARWVLDPRSGVRAVSNHRRHRAWVTDNGAWAVGPLAAHDFAPVVHFTSVVDLGRAVATAGLEIVALIDDVGRDIDPTIPRSTADNFTVVARRARAVDTARPSA